MVLKTQRDWRDGTDHEQDGMEMTVSLCPSIFIARSGIFETALSAQKMHIFAVKSRKESRACGLLWDEIGRRIRSRCRNPPASRDAHCNSPEQNVHGARQRR